jgi:hypothetical protein
LGLWWWLQACGLSGDFFFVGSTLAREFISFDAMHVSKGNLDVLV